MNSLPLPPPLEMKGSVADNWRKFRLRFESYIDAAGYGSKNKKMKTSLLLHVVGEEALEVYNTFTWNLVD